MKSYRRANLILVMTQGLLVCRAAGTFQVEIDRPGNPPSVAMRDYLMTMEEHLAVSLRGEARFSNPVQSIGHIGGSILTIFRSYPLGHF